LHLPLGNQTVIVVTVAEDPDSRDRYNSPNLVRTEQPVQRCRFRPLSADETIDETGDRTRELWRLTAPPVPAVINAKANDELKVGGVTYQIVGGVRVYGDLHGRPFKCTVICERQSG
jgi:hypothetical protein